jgi:hypothetical protein
MAVSFGSRVISALLLLAGMVLCLAASYGFTEALCITEGCRIYQGYSFLGFSLHAWGAAAFGVGLILLRCNMPVYRRFLHLCLWAEIVLLSIQAVYLPCSECLLVGLIWGLLALLEIRERVSVKIWSAVFLAALVFLGKDLLHPWPVYGRADAAMQVYFSPSCKACRGEIEKLLTGGEAGREQVAFIPVALEADDCQRVYSLQHVLNQTLNLDQAFQACWSKDVQISMGWRDWLAVDLGLIRNRLILARMGARKVPFVVSGSVAPVSTAATEECGLFDGKDCADDLTPESHRYRSSPKPREVSDGIGGKAAVMVAQAQTGETDQEMEQLSPPCCTKEEENQVQETRPIQDEQPTQDNQSSLHDASNAPEIKTYFQSGDDVDDADNREQDVRAQVEEEPKEPEVD